MIGTSRRILDFIAIRLGFHTNSMKRFAAKARAAGGRAQCVVFLLRFAESSARILTGGGLHTQTPWSVTSLFGGGRQVKQPGRDAGDPRTPTA